MIFAPDSRVASVSYQSAEPMFDRTSAANPPASARAFPPVMCSDVAFTETSPPAPMIVVPPTYALVVLFWLVLAFALPTPTKPPVELLTVALVLVSESARIETLPVTVAEPGTFTVVRVAEAMYAVTVLSIDVVTLLSALPTRPSPEPVADAVDTALPGGGESTARETPPGPTIFCGLPEPVSTVEPVMSIRSSWLPAEADVPRSTLSRENLCCVVAVRPVTPRVRAGPPGVLASW